MAISTKKIYAAQFIRCGSTFIREFITELDDFDGLVNSHFFSDKIFKDQTAVCTYREPTEWYFSQWNYARQRNRGEFHRLINSKIFRLKHFKRSLRIKYLSSFKIFIGLFLSIENPKQYYDKKDGFKKFCYLINSKKFKYIMGIRNFHHNQGAMFDWLCLASFSNKRKIQDSQDAGDFLKKNTKINHYIYLHGMDKELTKILNKNGYEKKYLEKTLSKLTPNHNRTKDNLDINQFLDDNINDYVNAVESYINNLVINRNNIGK